MKYRTFFSERSLRRTPSPIRALFPLSQIPGMLNLAGGLPHPDTFPIKEISIQLQSGTKIDLPSDDVRAALQYGPSYGLPSLLDQLNRFMESRHPRNGNACNSQASRRICVGTGSQDVLGKAFDMLLDPEDMVIVEEACYPGVLCALQVYNPNYLTIKSDEEGMIPSNLDLVVGEACLRAAKTGSKPPRVVYVCPTGQNPTGTTMSTQRKRDIYAVCQAHNLILLEDDPYYHLYFEHDKTSSQRPSFLSLDTDGRVLRFDSLSKVLSAGMRIGWVTGPDELVERIQLDMQTQALNVSGVSQVFAANILKTLGTQGFDEHVREVCTLYQKRRDQLVAAVRKYLSDEQVTFVVPQAGMFLWMNLNQIKDTEKLVMVRAQDEKVLFVPGCAFQSKKGLTSSFVRASYSTLPEQSMDEAMKRFRLLLDSECSVKS